MTVRPSGRDESGYTLTELLVTLTISAIIGVVVSQALLLTLKLGPETTARNKFATDTTFYVDALSDDVANATAQPTSVAVYPNCELDTGNTTRTNELGTFPLPTGTAHWWATISNPSGTPATVYKVLVFRRLSTDSQSTTMLTGYCPRFPDSRYSNTMLVNATADSYSLDLKLLPSTTEAERTVSFRGDRRTLTPPT